MKKKVSQTVEIYESENEIMIVVLANKDKKDYKEINLSLKALIMYQGFTEAAYKTLADEGLLPKKDVFFHAWIHPDLYQGLEENEGLETRMLIYPN
jgi:hypothetical protein